MSDPQATMKLLSLGDGKISKITITLIIYIQDSSEGLMLLEEIRATNSPLPFLASTPEPRAAVVVGLSSELL